LFDKPPVPTGGFFLTVAEENVAVLPHLKKRLVFTVDSTCIDIDNDSSSTYTAAAPHRSPKE
jgi:hypothetical protein